MKKYKSLFILLQITLGFSSAQSQTDDSPLRIFGYFQNSFAHETMGDDDPEQNSFNMQQLNLFFQKKLGDHWRAFVNFEFINSFSSSRQWGAANLEEAWAGYSPHEKFNLKFGLLLPVFNNLNEIKNRTPLLPYIIRPLAYETSFQEFIPVDDFAPSRAFVQVYGFLPIKEIKLDYAVYLGNSPNIAAQDPLNPDEAQQTGIDTTTSFLVGGRLGLRYFDDFKIGVSATFDKTNIFEGAREVLIARPTQFDNILRQRIGGDLSFRLYNLSFESEFTLVRHDEDFDNADLDRDFFYATLGYRIKEKLFLYASYWDTRLDYTIADRNIEGARTFVVDGDINVPNAGFAYAVNDRITVKAHFARVHVTEDVPVLDVYDDHKFYFMATALSIFF